MPKPNQLTTLRVEDFPSEQRTWLPRLFQPLNQVLLSTYNILNGRVDFGANIPAQDEVLNFTYGGTPQTFIWRLAGTPRILWVGQATQDKAAVTLLPSWEYNSSTQRFSINFYTISGGELTIGSIYTVFVRIVP